MWRSRRPPKGAADHDVGQLKMVLQLVDLLWTPMSYATIVVVVAAATLLLTGLPSNRARYRILAVAMTLVGGLATLQWFVYFAVAQMYSRGRPFWPFLAASIFFGLATAFCGVEAFRLRYLRRARQMPNHSTEPTASAVH